jgi:GT2 family glycosyltransferase
MEPDISISIVNTNNREIVLQCLDSVFATADDLKLEVIVVNNACSDNSTQAIQQYFPVVKIIEHKEMLGFSTNNNLSFSKASGRYLMLLNDDTIVKPGAFQIIVEFLDRYPDVGVVGANLLNPDGTQQLCYDYTPNPIYDGFRPLSEFILPVPKSHGKPLEVANVCGACMVVRSSVAQKVGYLDTHFDPLYSEEVDWCYRIKQAGWKIYHLPSAEVIHLAGVTMNRVPVRRYERIFEKKALFFRKHYGKGAVAVYKFSLLSNNIVKVVVWTFLWGLRKMGARDEVKTHWNMVRRTLYL